MTEPKKKKDIFYYLDNLFVKNGVPKYDRIQNLGWMINRFLSMDSRFAPYIVDFSKYTNTLKERYYLLLYRFIPKMPPPRNRYIKQDKEFTDKLVERYQNFYNVSRKETIEYLRILLMSTSLKEIYEEVGLELDK
jgi:hypothetical protein